MLMEHRKLGEQGLDVSAIGLGCMGMSEFYGSADEDEAVRTIHRALELGVTFLDTADMYGPFTNEKLVGRAIADRRDQVVLATKFGNVRGENGERLGIRGDAEYVQRGVRRVAAAPRRRPHRPLLPAPRRPGRRDRGDRRRDGELVDAGKVRHLGLSRGVAARRSAARTPCTRSPRCRPSTRCGRATPRTRSCRPCASSGIGFVAVQPARPRLPHRPLHVAATTSRRTTSAATTRASRARTSTATSSSSSACKELAAEKDVTPGQLALAWVLAPGRPTSRRSPARRRSRNLEENVAATEVELTEDDLRRLDEIAPAGAAAGDRYADMSSIDR